jgi:hypothetical protein
LPRIYRRANAKLFDQKKIRGKSGFGLRAGVSAARGGQNAEARTQ